MSYTLINFNIPNHLKKNFDQLVNFKRVSRTSILNSMIEDFCRSEFKLIREDGRLNDLIVDIEKKNPPKVDQTQSRWEDSYAESLRKSVSNDYYDAFGDGLRL